MKTSRANQLIAEIQDLTKQYHAEVSSVRKPWPNSIKDRVQELFSCEPCVIRAIDEWHEHVPVALVVLFHQQPFAKPW